ncbi:STAS domain-containing protein [Streptomyces barringtoniae]|uniref:STAS domain-containing protein n=1 Tax=Streptomyces barringtoniae TaxID=2892029 RepID=UPI001E4E1A61|nr:STAS domain-containing protein [Streptomyces barringtoniae]MCC5477813.1 STAS domain-containing protein [Streptomyces barringtoniae]
MSENDAARAAEHHTAPETLAAHRVADGATVVALHGEIDVLTAPALSRRLDALTTSPQPDLVLDLRPVTFIDCSGLGVLCRARNRALARQGRLRLITQSAGFRRILRVTGLEDVFEVHTRPPQPLPGPPR